MSLDSLDWVSSDNRVLINPRLPSDQQTELLELVGQFTHEFKAHVFFLSSGTTAKSVQDFKWVALSKAALLSSAAAVNRHLKSDLSDVWLHTLPDFHVGGLGIWARSHLSGAQVAKLPRWSCEDFIQSLRECRGTLTALVPAQIFDLVTQGHASPPSLRAVLVGGGALAPFLYEKAVTLGWPLLTTYGMTETCSQIATDNLETIGSGSAMEVLSHLEVDAAEDGRLRMKGASLFTAYLYRSGSRCVMHDPKEEGWFLTQDRGIREGRQLKILGRIGDFVKIGGESVEIGRLNQIFDELRTQLQVKTDVAILPVPDDRLGHVIHFISDHQLSEMEASELIEKFNARVFAFEKIRKWHRLEFLPRTSLGKLIVADCLKLIQKS